MDIPKPNVRRQRDEVGSGTPIPSCLDYFPENIAYKSIILMEIWDADQLSCGCVLGNLRKYTEHTKSSQVLRTLP